jgi:hypothetical protein
MPTVIAEDAATKLFQFRNDLRFIFNGLNGEMKLVGRSQKLFVSLRPYSHSIVPGGLLVTS